MDVRSVSRSSEWWRVQFENVTFSACDQRFGLSRRADTQPAASSAIATCAFERERNAGSDEGRGDEPPRPGSL